MSFGARLKEARKYMNLTQQELANRLAKIRGKDVSPAIIAQYESGNRHPKKQTINELGEALGLDILYSKKGDACFVIPENKYSTILNEKLQLSTPNDENNDFEIITSMEAFTLNQIKDADPFWGEYFISSRELKIDEAVSWLEVLLMYLKGDDELEKTEISLEVDFLYVCWQYYNDLNADGKKEALKRLEELTHLDQYKKTINKNDAK